MSTNTITIYIKVDGTAVSFYSDVNGNNPMDASVTVSAGDTDTINWYFTNNSDSYNFYALLVQTKASSSGSKTSTTLYGETDWSAHSIPADPGAGAHYPSGTSFAFSGGSVSDSQISLTDADYSGVHGETDFEYYIYMTDTGGSKHAFDPEIINQSGP